MEKSQKPTLLALHGFLGSTKDFFYLGEFFDLKTMDLRPSQNGFCSWQTLCEKVGQEIKNIQPDILMGYSMGGRLLKSNLTHANFNNMQATFVFLSSHLGFYEAEQEVQNKLEFNAKALEVAKDSSPEKFIEFWNGLELFKKDKALSEAPWSKEDILHSLKHWNDPERTLNQEELKDLNGFYFYGEHDNKYKLQGQHLSKLCDQVQVLECQGRGHRLLQDEDFDFIMQNLKESCL